MTLVITALSWDPHLIPWVSVDEMFAEIPLRSRGPNTVWDWTNPLPSSRTASSMIRAWRTILDQVSVEDLGTEDVMQINKYLVNQIRCYLKRTLRHLVIELLDAVFWIVEGIGQTTRD